MLARNYRFHGLGSLNFVYRQGKTVRSQSLSLRYALNNRRQTYRVAVVVSRKVHKSAVVRNRIRRRIYEAVRLELPSTVPPYDLVFTAFSDMLVAMPSSELRQLVTSLLKKAGLRA
jgi:ribonuclease P protein component